MAMLGLAFSKVAVRAVNGSQRVISGSISRVGISLQGYTVLKRQMSSHHYSTVHECVRTMKNEMKCNHSLEKSMGVSRPADFPFKIEDDPCKRSITLRREIEGENIDVEVLPLGKIAEEYSKSDGDNDNSELYSDGEEEEESIVRLFVKITKENGKRLDIGVSGSRNEIRVGGMSIKECDGGTRMVCCGGSEVEPDSELQCALREFVEHRGINKFYVGFLHDYMLNKSKRDTLLLLNKLMTFFEG